MNQNTAKDVPEHICVIGGGLLGSVLALRLRQQGFEVTLTESASALGGLASTETIGGYTWDRFYHVILLTDTHIRALIDELGLSDRLRWGTTDTGFFADGALHSMSGTMDFLRFPPLSLIGKLRLAATIFVGARIQRPERLEHMLATDWLRRWSGASVLDKIWLPLLKAQLGDNYRLASAAFVWAIIARMYAARRSGIKREMFGYLEGGYESVHEALHRKLQEAGVTVHCDTQVDRITRNRAGFTVSSTNGPSIRSNRVVATVSPRLIPEWVPQLSAAECTRLEQLTYQGVICASLLARKPLSPYYVTNIADDGVPFTGVIEMTALADPTYFGGNSLIYLPLYLPQHDPRWQESDDSLRERFVAALERMYPQFDRTDVIDFKVSRARQVLAVSTVDYATRLMPPLRTSVPGLYLLNSAQIEYGTLNVNETLGLIDSRLPQLLDAMRTDSPR